MLSADNSDVEERKIEIKTRAVSVIIVLGICTLLWLVLCGPLRQYSTILNRIEIVKQKILLNKKLILEREILFYETVSKIMHFERELYLPTEMESPVIWTNNTLSQCGLWQYAFTEDNTVPLGGQGRPIFSLKADLSYPQVLCILENFFRYSIDRNLIEMTLEQHDNYPQLEMQMKMEIVW